MKSSTIRGLEILDGNWCEKVSTFCGTPGYGCQFSPRYLLPKLAEILGNTPEAWRAASWTILSSTPAREHWPNAHAAWRAVFGHARQELNESRL